MKIMSKGNLVSGSRKHGKASRRHAFALLVSGAYRKVSSSVHHKISSGVRHKVSSSVHRSTVFTLFTVSSKVKANTLRIRSTFGKLITALTSAILAFALFVTGSGGGLLPGVGEFYSTLPQANAATAPDIHLQQVAIDIDGNVTKTINTQGGTYDGAYTYSTAKIDTYPNSDAKVKAGDITYQFVGLYYEAEDDNHQKRSIEVGSIGYYDNIEDNNGTNKSYYVIHPKDTDNAFPNEQYVDLLATSTDLEKHLFAKFYSLNDLEYITYDIPDNEKNGNGGDIKISSDNKLDSFGRQWLKKGQSTTITIDLKRDRHLVMGEDTWNEYKLDGWKLQTDSSHDKAIPKINVNRVNLNALSEDEQYWKYYKDWRENKAAFTNNDPAAKEVGRTVQTYVVTPNTNAKFTNIKLSTTAKTVSLTPISKTQNYNTPGFNFGSGEEVWGLGTQWPFVARQWGRDIPSGNSDPKNDVSMAKARYQMNTKNWDWWFNPETGDIKRDSSYNWGYFTRIIKSPTFDTSDGTIAQWNAKPTRPDGYSGLPFRTGVDWTFDYWGLTADTRTCGNSTVPTMRNLDTSDRAVSCAAGEQENWHFGSAYMTDFVLNGQHFAVPLPTAPVTRAKVTDLYLDKNGNPIDYWTDVYTKTREKNLNTKYQSENNEDLGSWQVRYHVTEGKNAGAVISMKLYNFRSIMDCPSESDGDCQEDESHNGYEVYGDWGQFWTFNVKGALNNRDLPVGMKNHDYIDRADGPWLGGTTRTGDNQNNCVWTSDDVKYNDVSPGITYRQDSARCLYKFATRVEINLENLQNESNDWYVTYQDYKSSHAKLVQTEGVETADGSDGIEIFAASDINKNDHNWQNLCTDTSMSSDTSKCPEITNWQWQKQPGRGGLIDNTPGSGQTAQDVPAFMRVHYKNGYIPKEGYTDEQGRGILRSSFDNKKTIAPLYGEALRDLSVNWNNVKQLNPDEYGYLKSDGYINSFDDAAYFVVPMIPVNQSYFRAGGVNRYIDAGGQQMLQVPTRPYDVPVRYSNKDGIVLAGMPSLADQTDTVNVKDDFSHKVSGVVPVRVGNAPFVGYDVYQCAAGDPNAMRSLQDDQCTRATDTVMTYFPGEIFDIRQFEKLKLSNPNGTIATKYLRLVPADTAGAVPAVYTFDFRGKKTDGTVLHEAFQLTDKQNDYLTFRGVPGLKARLNAKGIAAVKSRMDAIHNATQGEDLYTDKTFTSGGKQTIMHRDVNPQSGPWYWAAKDEIGMTTGLPSQSLGSGPIGMDNKKGIVSLGIEPDPFYFYYEQTAAQITVDVAYKFIDATTGKEMPYTPQANGSPYGISTRIAYQTGTAAAKTADIGKSYKFGVGENVAIMYDSYVEQQVVPGCPVEPNEASIERTDVDASKKNTQALYPNEKAHIADRDAGSGAARYSRTPNTYNVTMEKGKNSYTLTLTYKCTQSIMIYSMGDEVAFRNSGTVPMPDSADGQRGDAKVNGPEDYVKDGTPTNVAGAGTMTASARRAWLLEQIKNYTDDKGEKPYKDGWQPFHKQYDSKDREGHKFKANVENGILPAHKEPEDGTDTPGIEVADNGNHFKFWAHPTGATNHEQDEPVGARDPKWLTAQEYKPELTNHRSWYFDYDCPTSMKSKDKDSSGAPAAILQPGQNIVCYVELHTSELTILAEGTDAAKQAFAVHTQNADNGKIDSSIDFGVDQSVIDAAQGDKKTGYKVGPLTSVVGQNNTRHFYPSALAVKAYQKNGTTGTYFEPQYYLYTGNDPNNADVSDSSQWEKLATSDQVKTWYGGRYADQIPDNTLFRVKSWTTHEVKDFKDENNTPDEPEDDIPAPFSTKADEHSVIKVKFVEPISPNLPRTGGSAATTFLIIGAAVLTGGVLSVVFNERRRKSLAGDVE